MAVPDLYRHPDYRDLLAACAAEPLDDQVRLVLADWLEEHGDLDRATFIRIQLERAKLHEDDSRSVLLAFDEYALLDRHRRDWLAEVPDWLRPRVEFERGLPGKAHLPAATFLEHAKDDWTHLPLHEITLVDLAGRIRDLFDCERLGRITALDLDEGCLGTAGLERLAACRHLGRLWDLRLYNDEFEVAGIRALARSRNLPMLARLRFVFAPLAERGVAELCSSDLLSRLTHLVLYECQALGDDSIRALLHAPIDALTHLELSGHDERLSHSSVRALSNCSRLSRLESLKLKDALTSDEDVLALAESPYLHRLRDFDFFYPDGARNGLEGMRALGRSPVVRNVLAFWPWFDAKGDKVARLLAESPSFANVRRVGLAGARLTAAGVESLVGAPHLRLLSQLRLDDNESIGDDGARQLARAPFAPELVALDLRRTSLTHEGLSCLCGGDFSRLRSLDVSRNQLGSAGMIDLAASTAFGDLRELRATHCGVQADGAKAISAAAWAPKLATVDLFHNPVGPDGFAALASLPAVSELDASHAKIGGEGIGALVQRSRGIRELRLARNGIDDEGARLLADWPGLSEVEHLDLSHNAITDEGARALVVSPYLDSLGSCLLGDNPCTLAVQDPFSR